MLFIIGLALGFAAGMLIQSMIFRSLMAEVMQKVEKEAEDPADYWKKWQTAYEYDDDEDEFWTSLKNLVLE